MGKDCCCSTFLFLSEEREEECERCVGGFAEELKKGIVQYVLDNGIYTKPEVSGTTP